MKILRLDKVYHRATGSYVYYTAHGQEQQILDCIGGYGALLLGHNPPELVQLIRDQLDASVPIFSQLSIPLEASRFGEALAAVMQQATGKSYVITFTNTGTEAVEAGLKHSFLAYYQKIQAFWANFERQASSLLKSASLQESPVPVQWEGKTFGSIETAVEELRRENEQRIRNNRQITLAAEKAYHGKTLGALNLTHNPAFREPFIGGASHTEFFSLTSGTVASRLQTGQYSLLLPRLTFDQQLKIEVTTLNRYTGVFLEPVQGEGGVRPVPPEILQEIRAACTQYQVPLILDEIQSGFYRTGDFLASQQSITGDYYLLGKSLGGGMAKTAALLVEREQYDESFGLLQSSTFAEDGFSSRIGRAALQLAAKQQPTIVSLGDKLGKALHALQQQFPDVIREIRGRGLIWGIELYSFRESESYGFQLLARTGYMNYVYAGFLLNQGGIRVSAPLSDSNTLRLQPAVTLTEGDISLLIAGLKKLCRVILAQDLYQLIEYVLPPEYRGLRPEPLDFRQGNIPRETPEPDVVRVGFMSHFISTQTVLQADPSLSILDEPCIEYMLQKILPISRPIISGSLHITSTNGQRVHLTIMGLCITSRMCRQALLDKETGALTTLCHKGVSIFEEEEQVDLIGLGQYTSILTQNGLNIPNSRVQLTTGNTFTALLGIQAMQKAAAEKGLTLSQESLAVIGAGGNISTVYAQYFYRFVKEIYLLGSDTELGFRKAEKTARLICREVFEQLQQAQGQPEGPIARLFAQTTTYQRWQQAPDQLNDLQIYEGLLTEIGPKMPIKAVLSLPEIYPCKIVLAATSASEPFLLPDHFQPDTVLCDISVPVNCTPALLQNHQNIEIILGGVASLPHAESLPIKGLPLDSGQVFGCMGETLLLGLEGKVERFSFGNLKTRQLEEIAEIAETHGFLLHKSKKEIAY